MPLPLSPHDKVSTAASPLVLDKQLLESTSAIDGVFEQLSNYRSGEKEQMAVAEAMKTFGNEFGDEALHRSCEPGHFTASALVVERGTGRFVLLFHAKLQKWLQPGGHVDGNSNLPASALREAVEETGIPDLVVAVPAIDLDIHEVRPPAEQPHLHYDVRFLVLAPTGSELVRNHESRDIKWVTLEELDAFEVDESVYRLARQGLLSHAALEHRE